MLMGMGWHGLAVLLIVLGAKLSSAQQADQKRPWKGYSILGNGQVAAVYSDDARITNQTAASGVQHLYFRDYTADYVVSTGFEVVDESGRPRTAAGAAEVGMKNFFTAQTITPLSDGSTKQVLCFVPREDAVILAVSATGVHGKGGYRFRAQLRSEIKTDRTIRLASVRASRDVVVASWSNGIVLAIAPKAANAQVRVEGSTVLISGELSSGSTGTEVIIVPAGSQREALATLGALRRESDVEAGANDHWNAWMNRGVIPQIRPDVPESAGYVEAYKRNLYCVKAANLNGQIPADITGQFVTNNMPQLYPRDAMMCARVLLVTGHVEEARQVIEFWARREVPMKTPGEWYARYDAHGKAVDAGSGARFDEPEWDANGYYIYLLSKYHEATRTWLGDRRLFYELADFLVHHIGENGLLEEGGIVEWTGYLPATNMICSAALKTASEMASEFGDQARARAYSGAAQRIASALPQMFDQSRQTYADVRFTAKKGPKGESLPGHSGEKTYLWDTTANVGVIWGYPNHREIELSNEFYSKNTIAQGGGMQYFDSPDPGLAAYGHGVFFFTTAVASQYESLRGNKVAAKSFLDWMIRNANAYGLMPERILPDASDCSPATPLSWCSAEFASALLLWSKL